MLPAFWRYFHKPYHSFIYNSALNQWLQILKYKRVTQDGVIFVVVYLLLLFLYSGYALLTCK